MPGLNFVEMSVFSQILQYLLTGVTLGSIYAMVGLGFTMIYNATGIINFAQGEFVMLGGMLMVQLTMKYDLPLWAGFPLTVLAVSMVGVAMDRLAIRPLKNPGIITLIIITVAFSILLRGGAMLLWGKETVALRSFSGDKPIVIFGASILPQTIWVLAITFAFLAALNVFFEFSILGKAMRACSIDRMAARLMGINVKRMVMASFAISAALGAVAGIIITPISFMEYDRGVMIGLKGFCAAVLGGLSSGTGVVIAGFVLGIAESFGAYVHSGFKDAIALIMLLAVLFLKPSGMMQSEEAGRLKKF